jgi:hypothetical protein
MDDIGAGVLGTSVILTNMGKYTSLFKFYSRI